MDSVTGMLVPTILGVILMVLIVVWLQDWDLRDGYNEHHKKECVGLVFTLGLLIAASVIAVGMWTTYEKEQQDERAEAKVRYHEMKVKQREDYKEDLVEAVNGILGVDDAEIITLQLNKYWEMKSGTTDYRVYVDVCFGTVVSITSEGKVVYEEDIKK